VTAPDLISCDVAVVKAELVRAFAQLIDPLLEAARVGDVGPRSAEAGTWTVLVAIGGMLLTAVFAAVGRRATERAVARLGLNMVDVRLRMDQDYWAKLQTTVGLVTFPWFAFRGPDGRTHVPARELFPLYREMRVSEMLLEWESALASDHPFRKAASALQFFTHGASDIEDTTIERHAVRVGQSVPREWQYRTPEHIREILRDRAVLDSETGLPFINVSTDAHALRLFEDETWAAPWKMVNGIRVWCKDRNTGETIHIGGEFTTGDCHEVVRRLSELARTGHLPFDGDYKDGVVATICVLTDGLDWIAEHVVPLYTTALVSLDPYHVVEQVADAARASLPKKEVRGVIERARKALGVRDRRGRTHFRKGPRRLLHAVRRSGRSGSGQRLLDEVLLPLEGVIKRGKKRFKRLLAYVGRNLHRTDYAALRKRGAQIGSGAMESMHKTGSQTRMKRAGCRWTPRVAAAILNLRMLTLSGRWDEYWKQPGLVGRIAESAI
jgi:hypothetical protein